MKITLLCIDSKKKRGLLYINKARSRIEHRLHSSMRIGANSTVPSLMSDLAKAEVES